MQLLPGISLLWGRTLSGKLTVSVLTLAYTLPGKLTALTLAILCQESLQ